MNIKTLLIEFTAVFTVTFVTVALVTFLWSLIGHEQRVVNWETSFHFATIFGIVLTWVRTRETKEK